MKANCIKLLSGIFLLSMLSGCLSYIYGDRSALDVGYRVVLEKPLEIAPELARVFLQAGNAFPQPGLNEYEPSCSFEVRKLLPQPQTIQPDTFTVTHVQRLRETVVWLRPLQLASLEVARGAVDGSSPSDIIEGYHFWLYSEAQQDVLRMTCRYILTEPYNSRPPTLDEMHYALGDYASISGAQDSIRPGQF